MTAERIIRLILCLIPMYIVTAFCNGYAKRLHGASGFSEDTLLNLQLVLISYGVPLLVLFLLLKYWVVGYKKQK